VPYNAIPFFNKAIEVLRDFPADSAVRRALAEPLGDLSNRGMLPHARGRIVSR
jgi:hypothetical protein